MVSQNLRHVHLQEVGFMQIHVDHVIGTTFG